MNHELPKPKKNLVAKKPLRDMICRIGDEMAMKYARKRTLMIPILNGALRFSSRLIARMEDVSLEYEPVVVKSYEKTTSAEAKLDLLRLDASQVEDNHVIIVDDILDTGQTLSRLTDYVQTLNPASVSHAVMLLKTGRQLNGYSLQPEFVGTEIPDEFVVGMGLDYRGFYRNLSYIGVLGPAERAYVDNLLDAKCFAG